jgi:elongation factor P--beta-lysine ligase
MLEIGNAGKPKLELFQAFRCAAQRRLASHAFLRIIQGMPPAEKNTSIKKEAARLVRQLPDTASWDDLMYEIIVRQKIEAGLSDLREGRKHDHASIRSDFGLA